MAATVHAASNRHLTAAKLAALQSAITAADATRAAYPPYPAALLPVQVAQFLLESAWGASDCGGAKNYFGIKARAHEPFVERQTKEFVNGAFKTMVQRFKKYASMQECFTDHARLICERRWSSSAGGQLIYRRALAFPRDPIQFAHALTGIYASDPRYGAKLTDIMRSRGLLLTFGFPDPLAPT